MPEILLDEQMNKKIKMTIAYFFVIPVLPLSVELFLCFEYM